MDDPSISKVLAGCGGFVAAVVVSVSIRGYVVESLWRWFVSAPFGVREINIPLAIGIAMLASMMSGSESKNNEKDMPMKDICAEWAARCVVGPLAILAIANILSRYV